MGDVVVEQRGYLRYLTINRPDQSNSLTHALLQALTSSIRDASVDPDVRAIVLTGAGDKVFCAGADIKEATGEEGTVFAFDGSDHPMISLFRAVEDCHKPLVARINGHVMGGGIGLLCMCDLAVATDRARFGTPEVKIGVFPMMILGYMLRLIPRRRLLEMAMTGEPFSAAEALDYGLLNRVAPAAELDECLQGLLEPLLTNAPRAMQQGKQALQAMQDMSLQQCFEHAQLVIERISQGADAREGMRAFLEKREPHWV